MPTYKNYITLELSRNTKLFLSLQAGVTRGEVPVAVPFNEKAQARPERQLKRTQHQLEARQLQQARSQIAAKDRRIARLEEQLVNVRKRAERSENVVLDGVILPPKRMRPCGANFQDDEFYLESAKREADRLAEHMSLSLESSLLDVGSGPGRLAIGITQRVGEIAKYRGVDVAEESVRWGQSYITPEHPNFQFVHIDVENRRYNPEGSGKDSGFTFPFDDREFDIITLYSVFTHMLTDGVRSYLEEFQRLLRSGGRIYLTAFVEDNVPEVEENPQGYLGREWKGALHCVRYERGFFEKLLDESGFRLDGFDTSRGRSNVLDHGQRGLYISKL